MNPHEAYQLAAKNGPSKELEKVIATNGSTSYCYAVYILEAPFPAGEAAIARNPLSSYLYAIDIIKGRFAACEEKLSKDAAFSLGYAQYALKGPFPACEDNLSKSPLFSSHYAKFVLKGCFPKGESVIVHDIANALDYQFRFNRHICTTYQLSQFPAYALAYAIMIGSRFPAGEPAMKKSPRIWKRYKSFLKEEKIPLRFYSTFCYNVRVRYLRMFKQDES